MSTEIKKYYKIADVNYCIIIDKKFDYTDGDLLSGYVSEPTQHAHTIRFFVSESIPFENGELLYFDDSKSVFSAGNSAQTRFEGTISNNVSTAYMSICREANNSFVYIKPMSFGRKTILKAMELEHFLAVNNSVLFHCSYIKVNGKAILFTAPSGVGKSTQAELWNKHMSAELINGDRCALVSRENYAQAYGVPYCGSSGVNRNVACDVHAIVYLSQAPRSSCTRLYGLEAFKKLWEGICVNTWIREDMEMCIQTVTEIVQNVPIILLECTPDLSAVNELDRFLKEL